jgi:hypothetical protein
MTHDGTENSGNIIIAAGRSSDPSSLVQNLRSLKAKNYEYIEEDKSRDVIVSNNLEQLQLDNIYKKTQNANIDRAASFIKVHESGRIEIKNRAGASIVLDANGDVIIQPSTTGLLKLGGDDAQQAILGIEGVEMSPGHILAPAIISTMGGAVGVPVEESTGTFATKILVK